MADRDRIVTALRNCKLFAELSGEQMLAMAGIARLIEAGKGERLFEQGAECEGMFVVASGQVKVFKLNPEGKEHLLHLVLPGETFAEAALFGGFDYPASAQAVTDAELVFLPKRPMLKLLADHPIIPLKLLAAMSTWLRRMVDLMEDIVLRDAAGRLAKYILSQRTSPGDDLVTIPLKHQELAAHLGMTRETVSRTMAQLESLRLIALLPKGRVQLRDTKGLSELARA
jgi:CRP-like cAMP-binding protein